MKRLVTATSLFIFAVAMVASPSRAITGNLKSVYENVKTRVGPDAATGGWFINLGITGAHGKIDPARPTEMEVVYIFENTPADGKLKVGDRIIGANGKAFKTPHKFGYGMDKFGYEGPMMEIGNALEESQGYVRKGKLSFEVLRDGSKMIVDLDIGTKYGQFAATYPFRCDKSEKIVKELYAYLIQTQRRDGLWHGRPHINAMATLALLASGDEQYLPAIERAVRKMADSTTATVPPGGLSNWRYTLYGIVLAEYYLATKEAWVRPELEEIRDALIGAQSMKGPKKHGGWAHNSPFDGYGPICIITAQATTALGLLMQCGLAVDEERYKAGHDFLTRGTNNIGYVWYADGNGGNNKYADMGRTGCSAIARYVSPIGGETMRDTALAHARCIGTNYKTFPDTHGCPLLGTAWTALGASLDEKSFRNLMDQHRWYFNLAHCPDGRFYFQPNRDNNSQDYAAAPRLSASATMALIFSIRNKSLRIMGATGSVKGVYPSQLSSATKAPYELIKNGRFAQAHRLLTSLKAKLEMEGSNGEADETSQYDLANINAMLETIDAELATVLETIEQKNESGDVYELRRTIIQYQRTWRGVGPFDDLVKPIEISFRAEPRRTEMAIGMTYAKIAQRLNYRHDSAAIATVKRFAERYPDSYYGKEAAKLAKRLEAMTPEARDAFFAERLKALREQSP